MGASRRLCPSHCWIRRAWLKGGRRNGVEGKGKDGGEVFDSGGKFEDEFESVLEGGE